MARVGVWRGPGSGAGRTLARVAQLLTNRHDVTTSRFYAAQCHIVPVGHGRALSLKKAVGRMVLALGCREDPEHRNSELPLKDRLPNHGDVTSSWSGPPQSHIAVVACL